MIKADFHIHTVLSPCGDIEMTPAFIISRAKEEGIGIVGITDHNSTLQCSVIKSIGEREGIYVLTGAEITTKEEVHVLAFVDGEENLNKLQEFLDINIPKIDNNVDYFGYQLVVNESEEIIEQVDHLLITALNKSLQEVESFVHSLGGIFIPAHIDKKQNSLISQLGFMPIDLEVEALELSKNADKQNFVLKNRYLSNNCFIRSSDAHFPEDFGKFFTILNFDGEVNFSTIKNALKQHITEI